MFVFLGIPYIPALIWECLSFWVYRVSVTNIGVYPKRQRLNYWYTNKRYTQKDKITHLVLGYNQTVPERILSTPYTVATGVGYDQTVPECILRILYIHALIEG